MPVQRVVLLRFRPEVSGEQIEQAYRQIASLKRLVPGIRYFDGGPYSSPEQASQGYTHAVLLIFENTAARDAYLTHPEREKVRQEISPLVEATLAFDFESQLPF